MIKILLDATFSDIPLIESFLRERIHSENSYENHLSHFFWSLRSSIASYTADFEISIFNLTYKVPPSTSFEIKKNHLKECHHWLALKWIRQNTAFHRFLHSDALFGHCYTYLHVDNLAG